MTVIYDVIELRWYGGVYAGGDQYADLFQDQAGVPLEITSAVFSPNGVGGVTASSTVSLIALGTTASLNWEQAIPASYVLDADSNYVHPSLKELPLGTVSDLPFALTAICFMPGTLVLTPFGEVAVETLNRGDLVMTADGRTVAVDWLGIQTISLKFADKLRVLPIRVKAGALAENVPTRDLLVSPDHAILVEGTLIQAGALVNGTSVVRETNVPTTFTYYHVEVQDHSLILAENTPAETFVDNIDRLHFDNWAEHEALYPEGKPINEMPYPRAKSHRQVPLATRMLLAARAQAISQDNEQAA